MSIPQYISHLKYTSYNDQWVFQSNTSHSEGVAKLAGIFASEFGFEKLGWAAGILHDKGKETPQFQKYIKKVSGYAPEAYAEKVPHAFVGALLAKKLYPECYLFLSRIIAAHHTGLQDEALFNETLHKKLPDDVNYKCSNINKLLIPNKAALQKRDIHHLVRLLFSCLVDADFLDTEAFMDNNRNELRKGTSSLRELLPKLEDYLQTLEATSPQTEINILRRSIQQICREKSCGSPGFYSLTVPTGGGKTISSLLWAMLHALKHGKKRIIIAIPYTSIIVQTAAILRKIFGEENICEHHSMSDAETTTGEEIRRTALQQRLATENWDYPIIVTTNVQLFESMFGNKPSQCRKLHNIVNSVLILDEAQTLPLQHLQPVVDTLDTYRRIFSTSVLFTTASQPTLVGRHKGTNPMIQFEGLEEITEIIPPDMALHDRLRRVVLSFDKRSSTYVDIADRLRKHKKVLCVVNTRKDAKAIYELIAPGENTFHLSKMMCPKHIRQTIEKIKLKLCSNDCNELRVVSTQLIEAGVDIDFPIVFRQEAGLDSILQSAGRCNREGRLKEGTTHIFSLEKPLPSGYISNANNARKNITDADDWFAPETMKKYFTQLYARTKTFDEAQIKELLHGSSELMFEEAAKKFRLIDENSITVIVNWDNSYALIEKLRSEGISYRLMKELGQYSVNLRESDFKELKRRGLVEEILESIYFLPDREQYDERTGLQPESHWLDELLIK